MVDMGLTSGENARDNVVHHPVVGDAIFGDETLVTLAHGGGGKAMRTLIDTIFHPFFGGNVKDDQARLMHTALQQSGANLAFTTDGFVVDPLHFPGGNIGDLAVCGTVNDLAMGGAKPLWLSAAFIIEEGMEFGALARIAASMAKRAQQAGIAIVTGDTKVVGKGQADKLFITTSGVGVIAPNVQLSAQNIRAGDSVILSAPPGNHGAAILAARGDLALESDLPSDVQPLHTAMATLLKAVPDMRCARDATRGGMASVLNEMAADSGRAITIDETKIALRPQVRGLCEILGLDPLYLANEGTFIAIVPAEKEQVALGALRSTYAGREAMAIGSVYDGRAGQVTMKTIFGGSRIVDMLVGDQLPRIC